MTGTVVDVPTDLTVHANGQRIHAYVAGDCGPLVLLCHGFPESASSWHHQMGALAGAGYRAVAMDMRGYGRSSKPVGAEHYSVSRLVEDCVAVVDALGETTAVIVGHDFGAPVAWTAAWTRPDRFRGVVGLGMPFAGRGLAALPNDPTGLERPTHAHAELSGPALRFYQEYFTLPGSVAEREMEADLRDFLTKCFYSLSAQRPTPPELAGVDLLSLPLENLVDIVRGTMCVDNDASFLSRLVSPEQLPNWLSDRDLDRFVSELETSGIRAPLAWYESADLSWEELERFAGQPLTVPALYLGGDKDITTIWGQPAARLASKHILDLRGSVIIEDCGHWIQMEKPKEVNEAILTFLAGL
ncbi:MAG: alpha/beta fold hydrolase [Rhodococcus sp. (in: high G+C Gram-positive bacteria)]|uniref:alpha/beta fold hydrolase n=1 Tax=Rhodococcus sp. TaxID=1831 RepID=UPI002ADC1BD1|nr:alpha/beta fold hydrolase [Rhodococcus sp. (in: high G+C Gram-positive bacteria)]